MTDLAKLQKVFRELGIKYEDICGDSEYHQIVRIGEGEGYDGFCADFRFSEGGSFTSHAVWE